MKQWMASLFFAGVMVVSSFAAGRNVDLIFIGDSITWHKTPANSAGEFLRTCEGIGEVRVCNEAHNGHTTLNYLPENGPNEQGIRQAWESLGGETNGNLIVFSIMLGTNDSAFKGPLGAPVATTNYHANLKLLIERWHKLAPGAIFVVNYPIWYSSNTHNGACYLQDGQDRLRSYFPEIKSLVAEFAQTLPGKVFEGSDEGWEYFEKTHLETMGHEKGPAGVFFLHPNRNGGMQLGKFWGKVIYRCVGQVR